MLDLTQKAVGRGQRIPVRGGKIGPFNQTVEDLQGVSSQDARVFPGMDELQDLGYEFDLPYAAPPELDVQPLPVGPMQRALNFHLERFGVFDRGEVEVAAQDKRRHLTQKALAQGVLSGNRPRLEQSQAFPGLTPGFIVQQRIGERIDNLTVRPVRSQAEVNPKHKATSVGAAEGAGEMLGEFGKIGPGVDWAFFSAGGEAGVTFVQIDEIDVRTEIQFCSPELAHAEHHKGNRTFFSRLFDTSKAVVPLHSGPGVFVGNLDRGVGQGAQIPGRLFEGSPSKQVARADP